MAKLTRTQKRALALSHQVGKIIQELKTTKEPERGGRALDKETTYMMQKLRALGYM